MASFVCLGGRLKVAVSSGLQASGIIVLFVSLGTGFGSNASDEGKFAFFFSIFVANLLCLIGFFWLFVRDVVPKSMKRRDSQLELDQKDLWMDEGEDVTTSQGPTSSLKIYSMTFKKVFHCTKLSCCCIFLTVSSSMAVGSYFGEVVSDSESLPQLLFFTRLFADFAGRPILLCFTIESVPIVAIFSLIRFLAIPLFFVLAKKGGVDAILFLLVAFYSFTSGFIVTACFQAAPKSLPENCRDGDNLTKQASLLNIFLCFSIVIGVINSLRIYL